MSPPMHDEHRRLRRRHVIGLHRVRPDAGVAAGDEVDRIGRLGRHGAKSLLGRIEADAKHVLGVGLQPRQLGAKIE